MPAITIIGALLLAIGTVLMAFTALQRGRLSRPHDSLENPSGPTLEPARRDIGFLGIKANWLALLALLAGAILLLAPLF